MNSTFMQQVNKFLLKVQQRQDIVFAMFFLLVVAMLILPLPPILIDTFVAMNLGIGLLILITAIYLRHALDLSMFPTIVLVTTVFRLALSVSSTRLILSEGHAGEIILGFGNFVVAGNVVVGLVIFFIVAIVQFIVITKGSERIAEVSARFTLDALPGKQMSIDADLRNGDIDRIEARRRRSILERESQFFGAMDGSMRFVKGDAIAGIVIVFVNLIGGLIIGVAQKGMSFSEASHLYSLLSIGDGLVSQIPAMFISIAAGIVVTRVNSEEAQNMGADIAKQLGFEPKALALSSVGMFGMGMLPGFPLAVFAALGLFLAAMAAMGFTNKKAKEEAEGAGITADGADASAAASGQEALPTADRFDILVARLHPATREDLEASNFASIWKTSYLDLVKLLGFEIRPLGFQSDVTVPEGQVILDSDGVPVRIFTVHKGFCRVTTAPETLQNLRLDVSFVGDGEGNSVRPWVSIDNFDRLVEQGFDCAGPLTALSEDLHLEMQRLSSKLFGINEATAWLQQLEAPLGRLVSDVSQQVPLMRTIDIARRLLEEQVYLRHPRILMENLLTWAPREQENDKLIDMIRTALRRQINFGLAGMDMSIPVILVEPRLEEMLKAPPGSAGIPADIRIRTAASISNAAKRAHQVGIAPALVVSRPARRFFRDMMLAHGIFLPALSNADIERGFTTHSVDVIDVDRVMNAPDTERAA